MLSLRTHCFLTTKLNISHMICNGVVNFLFKVWQKAGSLVCDLTILILSKGKAPKWEEKIFLVNMSIPTQGYRMFFDLL